MARQLRRFEPLEYAVGTDGSLVIALKDSAGANLSVVGASASWKVYKAVPRRRRKPFTGNAIETKTSAAGEIALATGQATITITDGDFADKAGEFWHALQITDSSGNITHLGQGPLFLRAAI